jgi:hypothetical protein
VRKTLCAVGASGAVLCEGLLVVPERRAHASRADMAMLRSLPRVYSPAGRYVGPLASNIDPPHIILKSGIPFVSYPKIGYQRNPVAAAQYGLWAYGSHDERSATHVADWLLAHQSRRGTWNYRFDADLNGGEQRIRSPWISAMAQGQAMSLLERVYRLTGERRYLRAAVQALAALQESVARGGVRRCFRGDCRLPFFEEYPTPQPTYVLNGFMFTLIGLHDLASVAPHSDAQALYDDGRRTLIAALPDYDRDGLATYDLSSRKCAAPIYQVIHVYLLRTLNSIERSAILAAYADRWESHLLRGC